MKPSLDLVVPVYNEAAVLGIFLEKTLAVLKSLEGWTWRMIMVNDGSRDQSLAILRSWAEHEDRILVLDLSRNFGHEAALSAGLIHAEGDASIVMDSDLQDPPEIIPLLLARFLEGFDVVNAHRSARRTDGILKRLTARAFYKTINVLSPKVPIPEDVGNYRLISRRVRDILGQLPEKNRVFRVLVPWLGFPTSAVEYERPARPAGSSHYNYRSMVALAIDGISSATTIPLKFAVRAGFLVSAAGFLYLLVILVQALFTTSTVEGWASTMSVILFLGGIQLIFLGILGEYLGRIFMEVKQRPVHVIQGIYGTRRTQPPQPDGVTKPD